MRRIVLAVTSTVAAVIVLFGYRTSTSHPGAAVTATVAAGTTAVGTGATPSASTTPVAPQSTAAATSAVSSAAPTAAASTATPSTPATRTVTGETADTRWGPVQVQLTVAGDKVTAITLLQLPSSNGRDVEINNAAVPVLEQETLQAQSAQIDSVSGATYTSEGYISSLQSALDQAGL